MLSSELIDALIITVQKDFPYENFCDFQGIVDQGGLEASRVRAPRSCAYLYF